MYAVRRWVVRHAGLFEAVYQRFEGLLVRLHPLWRRVGYQRLDAPFAAVERVVKGFLFDTQMCGVCTLQATGMSCPMNCPKTMRNGPCGGVRPDGGCEVKPAMQCVWVDAFSGSQRMHGGQRIQAVQPALDHRLKGTSAWLREARAKAATAADETE